MIENSTPETERDLRVRMPSLLDVQRQHRAEAAIDELQPEDHGHHQHEVLEREHVAERDAVGPVLRLVGPRLRRAFARPRASSSHQVHQTSADGVETAVTRNARRRPTKPASAPPITGPTPANPLRRLHGADRVRHPVARRRIRRHRDRQRAVAGKQPLHGAQREHVPGAA